MGTCVQMYVNVCVGVCMIVSVRFLVCVGVCIDTRRSISTYIPFSLSL